MTLANCKRLLAHFEAKGMKKEAEEMRKRVEKKEAKQAKEPKPSKKK